MPKWLKIMIAAVLGLAVVYALSTISWRGSAVEAGLPKDPVKIQIEASRSSVTLEKKDGAWRLTAPVEGPTDGASVQRVTTGMESLAFESEVTRRVESHAQYDLGEGKEVRMSVWDGGSEKPFVLVLGKNAGHSGRVYARVGESPVVYLASGISRDAVDVPLSRWRNRSVLDRTDIASVRVTRGRESFILQRSTEGWNLGGSPADEGKVSVFISALRTLSADELVDPPEAARLKKFGLDVPSARFEVSFSTGDSVSFSLGKGDPLPLLIEGGASVYLIPSYRASALDKSPKDFFTTPPVKN